MDPNTALLISILWSGQISELTVRGTAGRLGDASHSHLGRECNLLRDAILPTDRQPVHERLTLDVRDRTSRDITGML